MLTNDRKHLLLMNPVERGTIYKRFKKLGGENMFTLSTGTIHQLDKTKDPDMEQYLYESLRAINDNGKKDIYEWDGIKDNVFPIKNRFLGKLWFNCLKLKNSILNKTLSTDELFKTLKDSLMSISEADIVDDDQLKELLNECDKTNQYNLKRSLIQASIITLAEKKLLGTKFTKYIDESELIKFVLQSERGLCTSYLHNFPYHVPDDVVALFNEANDLETFDNFIVLYTDPSDVLNPFYKADNQETKRERDKDPILFGLIKNSTKLYFIGDWIDEYCDLTFDKLAKVVLTGKLNPNNQ